MSEKASVYSIVNEVNWAAVCAGTPPIPDTEADRECNAGRNESRLRPKSKPNSSTTSKNAEPCMETVVTGNVGGPRARGEGKVSEKGKKGCATANEASKKLSCLRFGSFRNTW
jgi:hypothetical protein